MRRLVFHERFALAAAAAALTVLAPHEAWAGSAQAQLRLVSDSGGHARLLLTATGLETRSPLGAGSIVATVNGAIAPATAVPLSASSSHVVRRVMLALDTSGSMSGAGLTAARTAAETFLQRVPADVQVGLVTFSDTPRLAVAPTTSRAGVRRALSRLVANGETSLYDGIDLALGSLGTSGERAIVVLSDGADTRSHHSLASVAGRLRHLNVRMDAVALHTSDATLHSLQQLAAPTGGSVFAAGNAADLAAAFSSAAGVFATQLLVDVTLPAAVRGHEVTLTVSTEATPAVSATTHFRATADASSTLVPRQPPAVGGGHRTPLLLPLGLFFAGLVLLLYAVLTAVRGRGSSVAKSTRLLERFTLAGQPDRRDHNGSVVGSSSIARGALDLAERFAAQRNREERLAIALSRADVHLKPSEWIVIRFAATFIGFVLGMLLFHLLLLALLVALSGYGVTGAWLSVKGRRRLRAFEEHLPAALQLVASSVRAGFSLAQALDGLVREGMEPIAGETNRALAEARLGVPIEDTLDNLAHRMDSEDFRWVAMAIRIQREVGGNLAEVLLNTAMMMRERARLRRQVKALSAEGRLSAYILLALPILMSLYMFAFRRSYLRPLYTEKAGVAMLIVAVVLLVVGAAWMRKTVEVRV